MAMLKVLQQIWFPSTQSDQMTPEQLFDPTLKYEDDYVFGGAHSEAIPGWVHRKILSLIADSRSAETGNLNLVHHEMCQQGFNISDAMMLAIFADFLSYPVELQLALLYLPDEAQRPSPDATIDPRLLTKTTADHVEDLRQALAGPSDLEIRRLTGGEQISEVAKVRNPVYVPNANETSSESTDAMSTTGLLQPTSSSSACQATFTDKAAAALKKAQSAARRHALSVRLTTARLFGHNTSRSAGYQQIGSRHVRSRSPTRRSTLTTPSYRDRPSLAPGVLSDSSSDDDSTSPADSACDKGKRPPRSVRFQLEGGQITGTQPPASCSGGTSSQCTSVFSFPKETIDGLNAVNDTRSSSVQTPSLIDGQDLAIRVSSGSSNTPFNVTVPPDRVDPNTLPETTVGQKFHCQHCKSKMAYKRDIKRHYKLKHADVTFDAELK